MTLEPDGTAAAWGTAAQRWSTALQWVRLRAPPEGWSCVSCNEHKRIFKQGFDVVWPAAHEPSNWSRPIAFRTWILTMAMSARLAQ